VQTDVAGPMKDTRKTKYQQDYYAKSGFTSVVINDNERPQCVICCEVLANESFKVNKLMRHLKAKMVLLLIMVQNFLRERLKL